VGDEADRIGFFVGRAANGNGVAPSGLAMKKRLARAVVEVGFIGFLFYSNLLMGEYERSGPAQRHGLLWALGDIFTLPNFAICILAGLAGHLVVELLRKKLS
jgi:hypothetical protein